MKCRLWRFLISSRSVNKHGRHRQFLLLIRTFLKIFFSETTCPNKLEIGRKHIYKVLYKDCSFSFDPLTNMVATGNSCFWLVNFYESSPLNLPAQNELKFGRKHLWKVPIRLQTWQPHVSLVSDWSISTQSFSSKTASPNEWNWVGSMDRMSSIKIAQFVSIR